MKTPFRKLALGLASALALGAVAAPAAAQTDRTRPLTADETADMQCMVVFSVIAADPEKAAGAAIGVFYYLGRLEGRDASTDWLERFYAFAQTATQQDLSDNAERCGQLVADRGLKMQEVGGRLTQTPGA